MFPSLNSSGGWLGTTVSLFCSVMPSHLQQRLPSVHGQDVIKQRTVLRKRKRLGLTICSACPNKSFERSISVIVFTDAGRSSDSDQVPTICGLFMKRKLEQNANYHIVSRTLHKSKHSVVSIAAGKFNADAKGIDEGVVPKQTYSIFLGFTVDSIVL